MACPHGCPDGCYEPTDKSGPPETSTPSAEDPPPDDAAGVPERRPEQADRRDRRSMTIG